MELKTIGIYIITFLIWALIDYNLVLTPEGLVRGLVAIFLPLTITYLIVNFSKEEHKKSGN
jgi:ABC-type tungstate transport system substrate-binding protein